ncbi:BgTH12-06340 [Blumeria graminis f. sp. triticale]|uniref:BgTH12-06340 n=1 Tax=Blumeria graminis f. sp. triticale TaxID=1689686 RepID=A0A9W4GDE1_BLUGR|nr:BgTH12-06340 [Blumeria graminis f. sp. triticale]
MDDIDPAALGRPVTSTTPTLPSKSLNGPILNGTKISKPGIGPPPPRINLEPMYMAVKGAIGEHWPTYKEAIIQFLSGNLNQAEFSARINPYVQSPTGETEHLHNKLIAGIYGNATREIPDHGVASWVSANDKPIIIGAKPVTGDAAEQRLKTEVMQLPNRDRRRMKDLTPNHINSHDTIANVFGEHRRPRVVAKPIDSVPTSAGGSLQMTNLDVEIRKRYAQPLASESGEFPDSSTIESRMLPICCETGILSGHAPDAAHFMSVATETFIKEVLSTIFSKTRSNGPGTGGSAGTGGGANWIQTHKYRIQLEREEDAAQRGEILRDKSGLLPMEARAASERGPLGMADVRMALELGDCGLGQMSAVVQQILLGYREGEVEHWDDYTWPENHVRIDGQDVPLDSDTEMSGMRALNGYSHDKESDDWGWEGCGPEDRARLDNLLDSCLAV